MALAPKDIYPGQIDETDASNYPDGKAQNDLVEDDGTGTPLEEQLVNEQFGFQQALLRAAGKTPNGIPERVGASQYLDAVREIGGSVPAAHAAMQHWHAYPLPVNLSGQSCVFNSLIGVSLPGQKARGIVALGHDTANSNRYVYLRGFAGGFESATQWSTDVGPRAVSAGADGEWFAANTTDTVRRQGFGTTIPSTIVPLGAIHYAKGATTPYIVIDAYGVLAASPPILRGTSMGTLGVASGPAGLSAIAAPTGLGSPAGEFADNGGAHIVFAGKCTISGVQRLRVLYSSDNGATWTAPYTSGSSVLSLGVAWSDYFGKFVAVEETSAGRFQVLTMAPGGSSFAVASDTSGLPAGSLRAKTVAAAGSCIAKAAVSQLYSGSVTIAGVIYSFDLGATWRFQPIPGGTSVSAFMTLVSINNRFHALDGSGSVAYRSGSFGYALQDLP